MPDPQPSAAIEDLLAHADWLRALARRLVAGEAAGDVEQETWLVALENPPREGVAPKRWLAGVLRNIIKENRRSESARRAREVRVARADALADCQEAVERAQALRGLIQAVLELEEPYRSTLLLRYQDGLSTDAIAARQDVPSSTVRNRIARGLALLRERLQRRHGDGWQALLAPLLPNEVAATAAGGTLGVIAFMSTLKFGIAAAVLLVGATLWWKFAGSTPTSGAQDLAQSQGPPTAVVDQPVDESSTTREVAAISESAPTQQATQPAGSRGSLSVSVKWASDQTPARDVIVQMHPWGESSSFAFATSKATDAQGRAHFDGIASGLVGVGIDRAEGEMLQVRAGEETELALEIPRGMLVHGKVVDSSGEPVAFARIWISQYGNAREGDEVARADAAGRFTLRDVGEARFLAARAAGFAPSWSTRVEGKPGQEVELVIEMLPAGGELRGIVRGPDGLPLAEAAVLVGYDSVPGKYARTDIDQRAAPPQRLRTDDHGEFVATGIAAGRTHVECRAGDLAPFVGEANVAADSVARIAIDLQAGAVVAGMVHGADGGPANSVSIQVGPSATFISSSTRTAADGSFRLEGLAPGANSLLIGGGAQGEATANLTLVGGETTPLEVQLSKNDRVAGRVVDEHGAPLIGWRLEPMPRVPGQAVRYETTDADGKFLVDNWPAQANSLEVHEAGHFSAPPAWIAPSVAAGQTELVLTIPADCRVSAAIVGRLLGTSGEALTKAKFLWGERGSNQKYYAEMDEATGEFRAEVQPGFYELQAESPSMGILRLPVRQVKAGETLDLGIVRFAAPGRVRVKLIPPRELRDSFDRRTVSVDLLDTNLHYFGQIQFDDQLEGLSAPLSAGTYMLRVGSVNLRAPETTFEVIAGEEQRVELTLEQATMRSMRVRWAADSTPKEFLNFIVRDAAGGEFMKGILPVEDGGSTSCALTGLVIGRFTAEVTTTDGRSGQASFEVKDLAHSRDVIEIELR